MNQTKKILEVKNLSTVFFTDDGDVKAVDRISFDVREGKTLGLVGESGCGKSVTSLSIMRLIQSGAGRIVDGQVLFGDVDLLKLPMANMRSIRGKEIAMIFQEPTSALNPVFTIGQQIEEAIRLHQKLPSSAVREKAIECLSMVGIPGPRERINDYPHQLSGGMQQRVMIAMALSCKPKLLIADEPTTALDVTIQAQILDLLKKLQRDLGMAIIFITHDLGVIAEVADDVAVMYAGQIVERAEVRDIFSNPLHPYTEALLNSIPRGQKLNRLESIPGIVPSLINLPSGCRFCDRCKYAQQECRDLEPKLRVSNLSESHYYSCIRT